MKIKYFGTAAAEAIPAFFCKCDTCIRSRKLGGKNIRTRTQCLVNDTLLIDFPPDTYAHIAFYGLMLSDIRDIIVTHTHYDHFYADDLENCGLGLAIPEITSPVTVHAFESAHSKIAPLKAYAQGKLKYDALTDFVTKKISSLYVTPLPAAHSVCACSHIYDIFDGEKRFLYGNDSGIFSKEVWEYFKENKIHYDIVSLDCTYVDGTSSDHHMNIKENAYVKERFIKENLADQNTKFICTHFSHNGKMTHDEIEVLASKYGILTAYDTAEYEV